jgi:glutathione S-transferase
MLSSVTLFGLSRSVYTRIARLALEEKGVPYELQEVEIFDSAGVPPEHLARHPFGRIPVLLHGDFSLYETGAICRYIDEAFPGPSLLPSEVHARARVAQIVSMLDSYAYRPLVWGVFVQRVRVPLNGGTPDERLIAISLRDARALIAALASFAGDSPFVAGSGISLADLHAYPMLCYFCLAPEGRAVVAEYPSLVAWLARLGSRASVQRTVTQYEASAVRSNAA